MSKIRPILLAPVIAPDVTSTASAEEIQDILSGVEMAKLPEKDRRPTHDFQIGDLVSKHGAAGVGIILAIEEREIQSFEQLETRVQNGGRLAYCLFRAREFELRKEARRLLSTYNLGEEIKPLLPGVPFSQLTYCGKAPKAWHTPPSAKMISKDRFADILGEEEE